MRIEAIVVGMAGYPDGINAIQLRAVNPRDTLPESMIVKLPEGQSFQMVSPSTIVFNHGHAFLNGELWARRVDWRTLEVLKKGKKK